MKLIIAGSRSFNDKFLMRNELAKVPNVTEIVSGGARGADSLAIFLAHEYKIPCKVFPANWTKYGKTAGFIRNVEMAMYADSLLAFWDGESRGTAHMIANMKIQGKPTKTVRFTP